MHKCMDIDVAICGCSGIYGWKPGDLPALLEPTGEETRSLLVSWEASKSHIVNSRLLARVRQFQV